MKSGKMLLKPLLVFLMIFALISSNAISSAAVNANKNGDQKTALTLSDGKIVGALSADKRVAIYKGIPFAQPPVGDLRWKAPQPVVPWTGVKNCTEFSASAIQTPQAPFMCWSKEFIIDPSKGYSEDCLYLNVWTSAVPASSKQLDPVVVFIHGGGNTTGGASCEVYDGEALAKEGVVYVSINYRVGIFGFLALKELSDESETKTSGNYAILDQIAALKWVQANIAKFGGDPNNITIAGQSAGASNVNSLCVTPLAKGLFQNAVAMSGSSPPSSNYQTLAQKEATNLSNIGKSLAELRAMPAQEVMTLKYSGGTCVDGVVFPKSNKDAYLSGEVNDINFITGNVAGDVAMGSAPMNSMTKAAYETYVNNRFKTYAAKILELYPATDSTAVSQFHTLTREASIASTNYFAKLRSKNCTKPTYLYYMTHIMPGPDALLFGAFHTADVPYWFNYFSPERDAYWAKIDYSIGDTMSSYLANFAKTGNPNGNGSGLPSWTAADTTGDITYNLIGETISQQTLSSEKTNFWNEYYYNIYQY